MSIFEVQQGEVLGIIGKADSGLLYQVTAPLQALCKTRGQCITLREVGTDILELTGRENGLKWCNTGNVQSREISSKIGRDYGLIFLVASGM
jgi:ABC-type polysaccharide/polyol phosphate transport system ATPase subunit